MTKEELIKILDGYEVFVDDDWGGSYKSIISYAPDKSVSRAHTSLGALEIIDAFDKMQKEKQELIDYLKEKKKEYIELYNKSCDIIDFDRYESLNILCEEILSKIEKE